MATVFAAALVGCASRSGLGMGDPDAPQTQASADVNPARAALALEKILPEVSPPKRPESLKPLSERAAAQIAAAQSLVSEQRYTEAQIELDKALRYDPNHPTIHRMAATVQWDAGNPERARASVQRALEVNPDDAAAHYLLGRCHASNGDSADAIREFRTALLSSDFDQDVETAAMTHYHLAVSLAAEGYIEAALGQYSTCALKLRRIPPAAVRGTELEALAGSKSALAESQATLLERLGRFNEAADTLAASIGPSQTDNAVRLRYVRLLVRANRTDEALRIVSEIPDDADEVIDLLRDIYTTQGRADRIIDDLRGKAQARPSDSRLALRLADELNKLGRTTDARHELETFLEKHPDFWPVRSRLLEDCLAAAQWQAALTIAGDGIRLHPTRIDEISARFAKLASDPAARSALIAVGMSGNPSVHAAYLCGVVALGARRFNDAEELFRRSLSVDARFVPARAARGGILLRSNRYDEALAVAARADEDVPEDASLELVLGRTHDRLDDVERAAQHFKAASQLNPAGTAAMMELALLYRRTDDELSAQRQFRLILEKDPTRDDARESLAMLYLTDGKLDAAAENLEELKRKTRSSIVKARADALLKLVHNRDPELFRKTLLDSIESHGADAATWVAVAESYDEFDQEKAREAYLRALDIDPDIEEAALGVVFADQRLLNLEAAAERMAALLPRRPNRHAWRFGWPGATWRMGMIELLFSIQDYERAYRLAEEHAARTVSNEAARTRYRLTMVEALNALDRRAEAMDLLKSWCPERPDEINEWSLRLAHEYLRQEKPGDALSILEKSYAAKRSDRNALSDLVETLSASGRHDRANQYVLDWISEDPESDDALSLLIVALAQQDKIGDGLELVRNKLPLSRSRERFQDLQLALLDRAKRHDEAVEYVENLIAEAIRILRSLQEPGGRVAAAQAGPDRLIRMPNEPFAPQQLHARLEDLHLRVADQLVAAKKYRDAESRLRARLEDAANPRSRFRYLLALATSQRTRGDESEAGKTLEIALALQPDHVGLNNDVAYGWIDRGERLAEAERMTRYAVSREPRQMAYLDTLGWLMYKSGRFADARKWLERAVRTRLRRDAVVLDHLGDACWRLGVRDAAVTAWTDAVKRIEELPAENPAPDERRVREQTTRKLERVRTGEEPAVAPLGQEESPAAASPSGGKP